MAPSPTWAKTAARSPTTAVSRVQDSSRSATSRREASSSSDWRTCRYQPRTTSGSARTAAPSRSSASQATSTKRRHASDEPSWLSPALPAPSEHATTRKDSCPGAVAVPAQLS